MEYCKSAWIHTDFTPATCTKCGRFVFVLNSSQQSPSDCFACQRESSDAKVSGKHEEKANNAITNHQTVSNEISDKRCSALNDKSSPYSTNLHANQAKSNTTNTQKSVCTEQRTVIGGHLENGNDSETSSVHSNSSSGKKRSRRRRKHCPIHGDRKPSKDGETGETDVRITTDDAVRCRCRSSSKVKTRSKRPEPEGGRVNLKYMDENDWVIYNDDPLFSDIEDNNEIEEQIRNEAQRHHRRVANQTDNMFSAAQMVKSNTMLKFAIIHAELKNVDVSLRKVMSRIIGMRPRLYDVNVNENR